jgi:anti-sigma factor RsiW
MKCAEIQEMLPAYTRGETSLAIRRHLSRCPECKAELARYESLVQGLDSLQAVTVEAPPQLVDALMAIPAQAGSLDAVRTHVLRNRNAYIGGAAAAVAVAGAVGAALWRSRRQRLATA